MEMRSLKKAPDGLLAQLVKNDLSMNVESFVAAYKQGDAFVKEKVDVILDALKPNDFFID